MKRNSVFLSWLAGLSMKFGVQGHMDHIGKKSQIRGLETLVMGEHRKNEPILQIIPNSVNLASKK